MKSMEKYLPIFIDETEEYIQLANDLLMALNREPTNLNIVNEIFRFAHTIKGSARTLGIAPIADLSHAVENVLGAWRESKQVQIDYIPLILQSFDTIQNMIDLLSNNEPIPEDYANDIIESVSDLLVSKEASGGLPAPDKSKVYTLHNLKLDDEAKKRAAKLKAEGKSLFWVRVSLKDEPYPGVRCLLITKRLSEHGTVIASNPTIDEFQKGGLTTNEIQLLCSFAGSKDSLELVIRENINAGAVYVVQADEPWACPYGDEDVLIGEEEPKSKSSSKLRTIRVRAETLDDLMFLAEELMVSRHSLYHEIQKSKDAELKKRMEDHSRVLLELQHRVVKLRLIPLEDIFRRLQRTVYDTAKLSKKEVRFETFGGEIELDRSSVDRIVEPLMHMVNNAIYHGIESPEKRIALGKDRAGVVRLEAVQKYGQVQIVVTDDGAGIDEAVVKENAKRLGIPWTVEGEPGEERLIRILSAPGFTTAKDTGRVAGRGVGFNVVKEVMKEIGGSIKLETEPGKKTQLTISVPVSASISPMLLVSIKGNIYSIPLANVRTTALVEPDQIHKVEDRLMAWVDDEVIPVCAPAGLFPTIKEKGAFPIVILSDADRTGALVVDKLIGEEELLLKRLGKESVHGIRGATLLTDGSVSLIIDVESMLPAKEG